jgi:hypothetical protein
MRRLLIILMMIVLPFQLSWAAAATYCQHESSPVVTHYGHHVHKHLATSGDAKSDSSPSKLLSDDDCTVCHLGGVGIVSMPSFAFPATSATSETARGIVPLLTSTRPDRPERPKWTRAAL